MARDVKHYRQCVLRRHITGGVQEKVGYVPDRFAVVGDVLKLRDADGRWADGWAVAWAGPPEDAGHIEANERDHLRQRAASDVIFAEIQAENRRHGGRTR